MPRDPFEQWLTRLAETGVARAEELRGCTPAEIGRLEKKHQVTLPASYRRFLEVMGKASGRLFTHDHVGADYARVLKATTELRGLLNAEQQGDLLPADALVIISRDGEQYHFIRCDSPDDSPVWAMDLGALRIRPRKFRGSVIGWLRAWSNEAAEAVAGGYHEWKARH